MEQQLNQGLVEMGFTPTDRQIRQFIQFYNLLVEWNKKMNLTTLTEPMEVVIHHFLDSASCARTTQYEKCSKIVDLGTGAGFPGIPLSILYPEKHFTLVDSLAKRINFLKVVSETLGLQNVELVHARAEDAARKVEYRESFDGVVSRAVAALPVLLEYTVPFLKVNGWFICQKGPKWQEELKESEGAIKNLSVTLEEVISVVIPNTDLSHQVMVFKKDKETPDKYPRKAGTPGKKPL